MTPAGPAVPLRIDSVIKRFGDLAAVSGVSLIVPERACLGLLGPNGAGKSTLIRGIAGRVRPDSGSILVFGEPAGSAASGAHLGWVPQELALYPLLTCRENLEAFGRYQGLRGKALRDGIGWCLEWAALAERAGDVVKTLSGGMRRRLNMAAGLVHRPRLVLLDEPTVGVDPQSRNRIFDMVEELRGHGATIIYTTHYMEEAERLCDSIAIIDHGRIIAQGSKEELVEQSFGRQSDVLMRFASSVENAAAWVAARNGIVDGGAAHFAINQPAEIATLLDAAGRDGLEVIDVTLRRPNLESVFLHLTGRELRQ
ncbi:MAG TPA: ABC transporter ATP-binding protein [Bryobacteraceae bacterium]|nr:ABC transporter ATP-binding protein [Bryobacteraceae bacterium]